MAVGLLLGILLPGTQPGELTLDLRPPSLCENCHGGFASSAPNDAWKGTMMANAARDPLFQAALTIANQDEPGSGDLCLRCHSPRAFLFGRTDPPDGSLLEAEDYEGVQCDFCHRLTDGPEGEHLIGNAQYFVADDYIRRGPYDDAVAPHEWEYSPYHEQSELCALCHEVSNPLRDGFAIERTYSEWLASDFSEEGRQCQSCHLPEAPGVACGARGMPERDVHRHAFAGGNAWIPLVLAGEYPELDREEAYQRTSNDAVANLQQAAVLTLTAPDEARAGEALELTVRVENQTGHKLPTGYPEGRRMWLELRIEDEAGREVFRSGFYDAAEAVLEEDPQLRAYQVRMAAGGVEGFHFILQDQLLEDSRIPPRGFVPAPDTAPVGRSYAALEGGALAHWDDAPYVVTLPDDLEGEVSIRATLWYQTTSREYVESLRDGNVTDDRGHRLADLWEQYDRSPPVEMATTSATVSLVRAGPDAGPRPEEDAGPGAVAQGGGCGVVGQPDPISFLAALGFLLGRRRLRGSTSKEESVR